MFSYTRLTCLGIACALSVGIATAHAQVEITAAIPDFNEGEDTVVYTNGDATVAQGGIRLTQPRGTLYASAYYKLPITLSSHRSFSAYFTFRMTNTQCGTKTNEGADGLAFIIQPDITAFGTHGGGIGYEKIPNSVAIELDTHQNPGLNDPVKNHVGISLNGDPKSVAVAEIPFTINNGEIHHAWIDYDGKDDTLEVRVASSNTRPSAPLLSHKIDLEKTLATEEFVGFTAGTGTCLQQHEIFSFFFNAENLPRGLDTSVESYVSASR